MPRLVLAALAALLAGHGCAADDTTTLDERRLADSTTGGWPGPEDWGAGTDDDSSGDQQFGSERVPGLGFLIGWVVFGCVYKCRVTNKRPPFQPSPGGELPPLCTLFSKGHLCLHSCCCTAARAADTFQTAAGINYYGVHCVFISQWVLTWVLSTVALIIFIIGIFSACSDGRDSCDQAHLIFVLPFVVVWLLTSGFPALFFSTWRQRLRKDLGDGTSSWCMDCIFYWWCLPCSVAQDAELVDAAQGVTVECCCRLVALDGAGGGQPPPAVVGQAVAVGQVVAP